MTCTGYTGAIVGHGGDLTKISMTPIYRAYPRIKLLGVTGDMTQCNYAVYRDVCMFKTS